MSSELEVATKLLGHPPSDLEWAIISALWSEHCSYKSSKKHLRKLPKSGPRVLVGPGENAGVVDVGDGLAVAFKVESHNHPSFIEPFQGAATGMGGILRDIFTMGARPFAAMNLLRFGDRTHPRTPFLFNGVVDGISSYGNCFGVATVQSDVDFDACYDNNILVNAFAIGVVRHDQIFFGSAKGVGARVYYLGAKTGRDGIAGAQMASQSFGSAADDQRPTVQVGDPFKEKLLLEACMACFSAGVVDGIQDMGAAGLSCATFEMAERGNSGLIVELARVPLREVGMTPREIMLSESQERMLLVCRPGREKELLSICGRFDLDCVDIGEVTGDGFVRLLYDGVPQAAMPAKAIVEGAPQVDRPYAKPATPKSLPTPFLTPERGEISFSQYDQHIGLGTLLGMDDADAALIQIPDSNRAVALAIHADSRLCELSPREGARRTLARTVLQVACVGAKPIGLSDCLNFGSPERPEAMWQLVEAIEGLADAATQFEIPVVSGNVSLYNETHTAAIYPTPTVALVGLHDDPSHCIKAVFSNPGDAVIFLGNLPTQEISANLIPWDLGHVNAIAQVAREWVNNKKVTAICSIKKGGISATLSRMSRGMRVKLKSELSTLALHSEDAFGVVASVNATNLEQLLSGLGQDIPVTVLGWVETAHDTTIAGP